MWNSIHDSVIRRMEDHVDGVVCYADDTLLILVARNRLHAERRIRRALDRLAELLANNGLELNQSKTEVLVFNDIPRRLKKHDQNNEYGVPVVNIQGGQLVPAETIKYLGVHLDQKLSFRQHIEKAVEKCRRSLPVMLRVCQNTFGYDYAARKVMVQGAIYSHLFYCSSVFYHRLYLRESRNRLRELQRQCDRMCLRAYRTISADAAAVLNDSPPLLLRLFARSIRWLQSKDRQTPVLGPFTDLVEETSRPARSDFKKIIDEEWNKEWTESQNGPWTHQLFPTINHR